MQKTAVTAAPGRRVEVVDYLRFVAALSVVGFHYLYNGIKNGKVDDITHEPVIAIAQYGHLGVDLFFMISGYVIAASAAGKTARQFAVGRAVRLYPAFWVAVLITTGFAIVLGGERMGVDLPQVLVNLTMIPSLLGQPYVDGVYWTLLYELQFYALVFLVVLFRQSHHLAVLMPAWAIGMAAVTLVDPALAGSTPYLGGYFVLFAAGAIISSVAASGWTLYRGIGLAAAYLVTIELDKPEEAVVKTLIFAAVLATIIPAVRGLTLPGSKTVGAMTYPVYLLHAHIGYMLLREFATEENKWVVYAGVVTFVLVLAYLLYATVERPKVVRRFWKRVLDGTVGTAVGLLQVPVDILVRHRPTPEVEIGEPVAMDLRGRPRPPVVRGRRQRVR